MIIKNLTASDVKVNGKYLFALKSIVWCIYQAVWITSSNLKLMHVLRKNVHSPLSRDLPEQSMK